MDQIEKLSAQKEVVIFSKSSCCMCRAIKRLFYELGADPLILESRGKKIEAALVKLGCSPPTVFIGGKLIGSAETVVSLHLQGSLKNMLASPK